MSTTPVSPSHAEPGAVIHCSIVFDGGTTPVLCKSGAISKPATSDPRYVDCPACPAPGVANRSRAATLLCGGGPPPKPHGSSQRSLKGTKGCVPDFGS